MRVMTLWKPSGATLEAAVSGLPPTQEEMERMGQLIGEMAAKGVLVMTDGLQPTSKGAARVRRQGSKITVVDGPFTEAKEVVAGYAIMEVADWDEAIELTKRFLECAGEGESEVRLMHDEAGYVRA